tara:strand:- start:649 stop:852 length:204 start_codon:yes stop_codon:yes gene_type:complete
MKYPDERVRHSDDVRVSNIDLKRIADSLEKIATVLETNVHINIDHAHIDEIDHNHVEGDVNTHNKTW